MTAQNLLPVVAPADAMLPAEIGYRQIQIEMNYRVEWAVTQSVLPEFLCYCYWKHQAVRTDDREELVFYRRQELEAHSQEIEHWAMAGYNVTVAWRQVLKSCEESIQEKEKHAYGITGRDWRNLPKEHYEEIEPPYTLIELVIKQGSFINFHEIQARVNVVKGQLRDDLQLLRKLEVQWVGCETWERAKAKREATRAQQEQEERERRKQEEQEEQKQAAQLRHERRAAGCRAYEEMDGAYDEALQKTRTEQAKAQQAREKSRAAERRLQEQMEATYEETLTQQQQERAQKEEQERQQNPATYIEPITRAEEEVEAYLLKFRRRNCPPDGDLSVCDKVNQWKKALREQLPKDDAEDRLDVYERLERKLRNSLEDFKAIHDAA